MIRPRRSRSMPLAARLASRKVPVRLVSMTDDQSSSDIRSSSVSAVIPALATSTSTGPVRGLDLDERRLDGGGVGDVAAHVERPVGATAGAGGDRDLVALRQERLGDRAADAAVAAGHQHGPGCCLLVVAHAGDASDYPPVAESRCPALSGRGRCGRCR